MKFLNTALSALCCFLLLSCLDVHAKESYSYRLKWLFNTSVAGDIYADQYDYFKKAGLDIRVKEGGPEKNAIKELELGQAHFGVASADQVIRALEKGADVVVIAQIFQINPMQWIYRTATADIKKLGDLKGKNIGVTFGGNDESILNTLLAKGKIKRNEIQLTSARFDFTPFLTEKVDIWPVYRNSQGVILEGKLAKANERVDFFNPADYGVNFVANSVVTSKKMIEKKPEVVQRFRKALLAAWTDAIDPANEEKAIAAIAERDKGNKKETIRMQLKSTRDLVAAEPFGSINIDNWKMTEEIMLREKQIKKPVHVDKVIYSQPVN